MNTAKIGNRTIALLATAFLAFTLALSALSLAVLDASPAFAASAEKIVTLPLNADSNEITTIDTKWSWDWFKGSAKTTTANTDLAIASAVLSGDVEAGDSKIRTALRDLGFKNVKKGSESGTVHDVNHPVVWFGVSPKKVNDRYVVAVVVRGTTSPEDVLTDIGSVTDGFNASGKSVSRAFENWLNSVNSTRKSSEKLTSGTVALWITGHSLGAASACQFAVNYSTKFMTSKKFVYVFALPNYDIKGKKSKDYKNIHYYVNVDDAVPLVPPGYKKLGNKHAFDYIGLTGDTWVKFNKAYTAQRQKAYPDDKTIFRDHLTYTYLSYLLTKKSSSEIDDMIDPIPAPELVVEKVNATSVKLRAVPTIWMQSPYTVSYSFSYKKLGASSKWENVKTSSLITTIKGLKASTKYCFRVKVTVTKQIYTTALDLGKKKRSMIFTSQNSKTAIKKTTAKAKSLTSTQRSKLAAAICGLEKNGLVDRSTRSWKKLKITGTVRAAMAAEYLCEYKRVWQFSKSKLKSTSKSLFGSNKIKIGGCIMKDSYSGKYTVGGWGNVCCKVTKKMKSLGKGYYRAEVVFGSDGMFPGSDTTWTYYRVKLKKSSKAAMGYRIVSISAKNDMN